MATDIRIGEQKCQEFYAKQGYSARFESERERDSYLEKEIRFIDQQLWDYAGQEAEIKRSQVEDQVEAMSLGEEKKVSECSLCCMVTVFTSRSLSEACRPLERRRQ